MPRVVKLTGAHSSRSIVSSERLGLLIAILLIFAYTLTPFEFSINGSEILSRAKEAMDITFPGGTLNLASHFAMFFILGGVIAAVYERSLDRHGFIRFAVAAAVFCVGLEFAQLLLQGRHARVTDLLANSAGVLLGVKSSIRWVSVRAFRVALEEGIRRHPVRFQTGIFILAMGIWCSAGLRPVMGSLKMDWNEDYRLLIANETDGSRPWLGEIRYVGIYGKALTPRQVSLAYDSVGTSREDFREMKLLVGYDFTQGDLDEIAPEGLLRSGDLAIQVPAALESGEDGGGVLVEEDAILASQGPASELTAAILSSGAFSIEAWIRPFNRTQRGPARIVSLSNGVLWRNFTLGQEAADGVFRVRNGINGPNGSEHALHVKGAVQNSLQHWVAVYDHGVSSMFRDGRLLSPPVDLREPAVSLLLGSGAAGRAVGALLLVMTLALPAHSICSFLRLGGMRHLTAMLVVFCAGSLPYAAVCLLVGGPWRPDLFFWLAVALVIAYPLCFMYVRRPETDKQYCVAG